MNKPVSETELKFVAAKVKGKSNSAAALDAKPGLSKSSAGKVGNRLSKSVNVQALLAKKLNKHNISIDRALKPIDKGLDAKIRRQAGHVESDNGDGSKSITYIYEDEDNIPLQLTASDRALKLLGVTDKPQPPAGSPDDHLGPALLAALQAGNIEELQRVIFKQPENPAQG